MEESVGNADTSDNGATAVNAELLPETPADSNATAVTAQCTSNASSRLLNTLQHHNLKSKMKLTKHFPLKRLEDENPVVFVDASAGVSAGNGKVKDV